MGRAEEILKGLASLREDNMLCDIQLEAEGRHISAHKAVLAAYSPYFRAMFCGAFRETAEKVVYMKEMSFIGLKNVIECIYATDVITTIDVRSIEHVLPTAHMLQMNDIVQELVEWMGKNINTMNCLLFLEMAKRFSIERLQNEITAFILKNFVEVSELTDFENIPKATLIDFLASDTLKTNTDEFVVYKAARKWILARDITSDDVVEIMSQVRFGLIDPDQLEKEILCDQFMKMNCHDLLENAMQYHANLFSHPLYKGTLNKPHGEAGLFLIPNGDRAEGYNMEKDYVNVEFFSFPEVKHSYVSLRLDIPIVFESMTCITVNNFLYLFGVCGHTYQTFTKRYHASTDTWLDLAVPVPKEALVGRAIAHSGNNIFLLGGLSVDSETEFGTDPNNIVRNMDVYDIPQNTWTLREIPEKLTYASAAELRGHIYLTGGDDGSDEFATNQVWAYDENAKLWQPKAPMNQGRYFHVLEAVAANLYVIGGRCYEDDNISYEDSIEMYTPVANQWTVLLSGIGTNFGHSSFVVGNKIYLVGGNDSRDDVYQYDVETKELSVTGELPSYNTSTRNVSAFMILPKLL